LPAPVLTRWQLLFFSPGNEQLSKGEDSLLLYLFMPKGFSEKKQSKKQYIQNFIKYSKEVYDGFETIEEACSRNAANWFMQYSLQPNRHSVDELLNPKKRPLSIVKNRSRLQRIAPNLLLMAENGMWRIAVARRDSGPGRKQSLEFDIAVLEGQLHRFHSRVIKQSIVVQHGELAYLRWREIVKEDFGSLVALIDAVRSQLTGVAWSYTCSPSSKRLCTKAGVSIERGVAFLFPASYS
jgi:hypothetical protein